MSILFRPGETHAVPLFIPHDSLGLTKISDEPRVSDLIIDSATVPLEGGSGFILHIPPLGVFRVIIDIEGEGSQAYLQFNSAESPGMKIRGHFEYTQLRSVVEKIILSVKEDTEISYSLMRLK